MSDDVPQSLTDHSIATLGHTLGAGGVKPALTQRELARALGFALLDTLKNDTLKNDLRYVAPLTLPATETEPAETKPLHVWLERMLDATWPATSSPEAEARFNALAPRLLAVKDANVQHSCVKFLTRLGHLYQLAGLLARDNLLQQTAGPSTARAFLDGDLGSKKGVVYRNAVDAVAALNKPSFELTFTAHPTNTSSVASMQELRELGQLLARWKKDDGSTTQLLPPQIRRTLQAYADTPVLPMQSDTQPRNISVREEADHMLHYLGNSYTDLTNMYASYDKALGGKFPEYRPETLKLGIKFHSWGSSGDKDGNKSVNADTTLYALAAHHAEILERYKKDLNGPLRDLPGMYDWVEQIKTALGTAQSVRDETRTKLDGRGHFDEEKFDKLSQKLKTAVAPLNARAFEADLEKAYQAASAEQKPAMLALMRRVHTFGFSFGKIEYRETAEEYERIVCALLPEYRVLMGPVNTARHELETLNKQQAALFEAGDTEGLAALTQNIRSAEQRLDSTTQAIEPERRRILTQVMHDDARREALVGALKHIGEGGNGNPYDKDNVAPISYQTRKRMELARDFPNAIQNHVLAECQNTSNMLEALLLQHAVADGDRHPTLGIIPLFEDGDKLKAAPDIIKAALDTTVYRAHVNEVARAQVASPAQQVQLAHSDNARRNGMPAARGLIYQAHEDLRAMMKDYGDINLQFYEGGSQSDPYRGGGRAISATVNEFGIHDFTKMLFQGGDLLNYLNQPMSSFRLFTLNLSNSAATLAQPEHLRRKSNPAQERKVVEALDTAKQSYVDLFESPELNRFMEAVGYVDDVLAGNTSSRAGARNVSTKVDVKATRSVGYSTVLQHTGISPTWLGMMDVRATLSKQFGGRKDRPAELHQLYMSSPPLRDAIDRAMDGLALSDLEYADKLSNHNTLMPRFVREYTAAFSLCYEAYTGKTAPTLKSTAEMRRVIIDTVFPHMKDVYADQDHYLTLARGIKRAWLPDDNGTSNRPLERRLLHNALNTVYHGRRPLIDDTTYAKLYTNALEIERPFAPKASSHNKY